MFSKDTFCSLPWSSVLIGPTGDSRVCCFMPVETTGYTKDYVDGGEPSPNILTHELKDMLNSRAHREIRIAQANNQRHPLCRMCWENEDAALKGNIEGTGYHTSTRQWKTFEHLVDMQGVVGMEEAQNLLLEDGSLRDPNVISLDLRFTNTCNMKCIMCRPSESNMWYEDYTKLNKTNDFEYRGKTYTIYKENNVYKADIPVWHDSPIWWSKFDEIKHNLRHLYITGGEPFLVKGHERLLDSLIESDCAKDIELEYDTNLSVINDRILNKLVQFKNVTLSVSVDDIEKGHELIRFPGNFETLTKNIGIVLAKGINIRWVSTCVGIYSVFAPLRLYDYFSKNPAYNQNGRSMALGIRFLKFPDHANIAHLPRELKLKIMGVYHKADFDPGWKKHILGYLASNMDSDEDMGVAKLQEHIKFLNDLDNIRGTNWQTALPDVAELLRDYL